MSLHKLLLGLLLFQLGLAALVWWPRDQSALQLRPLLEMEKDEIVELRITRKPAEGQEADPLHLVRGEEGWTIASEQGYPADSTKVDEVLDKLVGLKVRSPIATKRHNHNALRVGDEEYGRRVVIQSAGNSVELVFGSAASNSVHVRLADASEVYLARGLSEWSLRDSARSYYDSDYVRVDPSLLTQLSVHNQSGRLGFVREGDEWRIEEAPEGSALDQDEIKGFLERVTSVQIAEPAGREIRPEYDLEADDARVRVDWTLEEEDQSIAGGYRLGATVDARTYVKAAGNPFVIKATESRFETLRTATLSDFLEQTDE